MPHVAAAVMLATAALSGCTTELETPTLDGTSWQLVTIESMADHQGSTGVDDPASYTVSFAEGGQAAFQIDCNHGSGAWEAAPSGTDGTGTLTFGPIALTMMSCPQPSVDQQVSSYLPFVRGYVLADDRLHMSLEADGAILTWEPHG
ncbi:MAG: META domain-containing protein [Mycobacterium sp.]